MKRADHMLVQRVLDGDIDREDFVRFQQRLREEPELMDLYAGYAKLHHTLHEEFESGLSGAVTGTPSRRVHSAVPGLAAVLLLSVLAWWLAGWPRLFGSHEAAAVMVRMRMSPRQRGSALTARI